MLDDDDRWRAEAAGRPPCRIEVEDVVVGQLLAAKHRATKRPRARAPAVVGGGLVRVFAVAQRLGKRQTQRELCGQGRCEGAGRVVAREPVMDGSVVIAGVREGFGG